MKKGIALLLICLLLLTACSSNSNSGSGSKNTGNAAADNGTSGNTATTEPAHAKEITIWAWDPAFNIAALEVAKRNMPKPTLM